MNTGFAWTTTNLRVIGHAQFFRLKYWQVAKATCVAVRKNDNMDLEVTTLLGTIYQHLHDIVRLDQALNRALKNSVSFWDRAAIRSLVARNAKILWEIDRRGLAEIDAVQKAALSSQHL